MSDDVLKATVYAAGDLADASLRSLVEALTEIIETTDADPDRISNILTGRLAPFLRPSAAPSRSSQSFRTLVVASMTMNRRGSATDMRGITP